MDIFLTIAVGAIGAYVFYKIKVPAGALVGALIFTAVFSNLTGIAAFPKPIKIFVQAISGAFIGLRIDREALKQLKTIIKPSLQFFFGILALSFGTGILIHTISGLDIATSVLSSVPGGITDVSIISSDIGANPVQTTMLQLARYFVAVLVLPQAAIAISKREKKQKDDRPETGAVFQNRPFTWKAGMITILLLCGFGWLGSISPIPAGALLLSLIAVSVYNVLGKEACLPSKAKLVAQCCAGIFIGIKIDLHSVAQYSALVLPVVLVVVNCLLMNYLLGFWIYKTNDMDLATSLFASIPAGVSDMALISLDYGGDAPKVAVLQLVRYVSVMCVMPSLIRYFALVYPF